MNTKNRLADDQRRGWIDNWIKKVKGLTEKHTCIPHGHTQQFGDGQGREMWG